MQDKEKIMQFVNEKMSILKEFAKVPGSWKLYNLRKDILDFLNKKL